ncbi:MAG: hypothetical protein WBK77_08035 [Alphaproteobacteria bacterium]
MTPSEKLQLQEALIKYKQANGIKGQHYWVTILQTLGMPIETMLVDDKEVKPALHENDPRNWIKNQIEPGKDKLDVYVRFIQKVYPDFKFKASLTEEYIQIGLTLARFSIGAAAADDPKLHREAKNISGSVYLSKSYQRNPEGEDDLCKLLSLQAVPGSPFLVVRRFCLTELANYWLQRNELTDYLPQFYESTPSTAHDNLRRLAKIISGSLHDLLGDNLTSIKTIYKGIVSPVGVGQYYHGILQSSNYLPDHVSIKIIDEGDNKAAVAREVSHFWDTVDYVRCDEAESFERIFSTIGEPVL